MARGNAPPAVAEAAQLGKYQLVKRLAAGGMAEVYLARTVGPGGFKKSLVVKRILPHLAENPDFVEMFINEARLAALLNHPNIIQIFELGEEEGSYYIAMELVDGPNLRVLARMAESRREFLPVPAILKIISLACEGLAYAHDFADDGGEPLGLVHRDISPDNILLSRSGAVKVADFGIAKAANLPNLTKAGMLKGKITYMAPEQLMGHPLDKRADLFALGVVLHEVLTGAKPFDATSEVAAMRSILDEAPTRLSAVRGDVPEGLQEIVDKALAKDRNARYEDARAFQADIEALLLKMSSSVRAVDVSNLIARYFPLQPTATSAAAASPGQDDSLQGMEVSLSMVIDQSEMLGEDGAGRQQPRTPAAVRGPAMRTPAPRRTPVRAAPQAPQAPPPRKSRAAPLVIALGVGTLALFGGALGGVVWLKHDRIAPPVVHPPVAAPSPAAPVQVTAPVPHPSPAAPAAAPPAPAPPAQAVAAPSIPPPAHPHPVRRTHEARETRRRTEKPEARATAAPAAPVVAAHPAAAEGPGKLVLRIQPWAEVEIDGHDYGMTPLPPMTLLPGNHSVRLRNSDLHVDRVITVTIGSGAQSVVKQNLAD